MSKANPICSMIYLIAAIGISTLFHEYCHLAVAGLLGHRASLGPCTLTSGSVFIHSTMSGLDTALIAVAGSAGLIIAGIALVKLKSIPAARIVGMVFLSRAWVDALPVYDLDGAFIAQGVGTPAAWLIAIAEIVVCGSVIYSCVASAYGRTSPRAPTTTAASPHRQPAHGSKQRLNQTSGIPLSLQPDIEPHNNLIL